MLPWKKRNPPALTSKLGKRALMGVLSKKMAIYSCCTRMNTLSRFPTFPLLVSLLTSSVTFAVKSLISHRPPVRCCIVTSALHTSVSYMFFLTDCTIIYVCYRKQGQRAAALLSAALSSAARCALPFDGAVCGGDLRALKVVLSLSLTITMSSASESARPGASALRRGSRRRTCSHVRG